jgi:hypothetical protein
MGTAAIHPETHNILGSLNGEDLVKLGVLAFIFWNS